MTIEPQASDKFQSYLVREKQLRLTAWVATLLPLAVFVMLLALTVNEKSRFQELRRQNAKLVEEISENQKKLERMKPYISYYASQLEPGVNIFYANQQQRSTVNEVAGRLRKSGYQVTVDDKPLPTITKNTYVRYFFKEDEPFARQVQDLVRSDAVDATVQDLTGDDEVVGYVKPRTLELWIGEKFVPRAD